MTKAIMLARVSTLKQDKEGLSLREIHFALGVLGHDTLFVVGLTGMVSLELTEKKLPTAICGNL